MAYTAGKAAIAAMSLTMARDLGTLGIRVLSIAPSLFLTGGSASVDPAMEKALLRDTAFPHRAAGPRSTLVWSRPSSRRPC